MGNVGGNMCWAAGRLSGGYITQLSDLDVEQQDGKRPRSGTSPRSETLFMTRISGKPVFQLVLKNIESLYLYVEIKFVPKNGIIHIVAV